MLDSDTFEASTREAHCAASCNVDTASIDTGATEAGSHFTFRSKNCRLSLASMDGLYEEPLSTS